MNLIDYSWDFTKEEFSLDLDFFNEKEQEDKLWQARTGLNTETLCGAIETIIFMSDKPVNLQKIKNTIDSDLPLRVVHESIARLQAEYEAKHHGIRLMEVAHGYQFRTKATYSKIIQNMFKVASVQMSPTALEVLSIIAYKQPISRTAIETIRGVDSSHVVRQLMDKRLVRISGRSDEAGRPSQYSTSNEFLEIFNLATIDELPTEAELTELATASDIGQISDIKNIVNNTCEKKFDYDELEELDFLTSQIKEIASETMFTKTLKDMDKKRNTEEGVEKKSAFDLLEEFVSKAQVIDQNKDSIESETLMSFMDPRSVNIALETGILNAPEAEEDIDDLEMMDEDGFVIDLELEADEDDINNGRELPEVSLVLSDDFDDSDIIDLDIEADDVLAASEELLSEASRDEVETSEEKTNEMNEAGAMALAELISSKISYGEDESSDIHNEKVLAESPTFNDAVLDKDMPELFPTEEEIAFEAETLASALDDAFDKLMGDNTLEDSTEENSAEENIAVEKEDAANAQLIAESLDAIDEKQNEIIQAAKDLDLDIDFLNDVTKVSSEESPEL